MHRYYYKAIIPIKNTINTHLYGEEIRFASFKYIESYFLKYKLSSNNAEDIMQQNLSRRDRFITGIACLICWIITIRFLLLSITDDIQLRYYLVDVIYFIKPRKIIYFMISITL